MTNEQLDKCSRCGMCKANCPVFRILLKESYSPRGRAILISKDRLNELLTYCVLCGACEESCPVGIELPDIIRDARAKMVKSGKETKANKKMIENIRKHGNPFGNLKKGEIPKELYCC
jgi:Fe-S oxidoreductase